MDFRDQKRREKSEGKTDKNHSEKYRSKSYRKDKYEEQKKESEKDIYSWIRVPSENGFLKKKLRSKLVEMIGETSNRRKL